MIPLGRLTMCVGGLTVVSFVVTMVAGMQVMVDDVVSGGANSLDPFWSMGWVTIGLATVTAALLIAVILRDMRGTQEEATA